MIEFEDRKVSEEEICVAMTLAASIISNFVPLTVHRIIADLFDKATEKLNSNEVVFSRPKRKPVRKAKAPTKIAARITPKKKAVKK